MRRYFFPLCLLTLLLLADTQTNAQWKQLEVGPPGQAGSLGKMGNYVFAGAAFAGTYRSTDQGKSWTNVSPYFTKCFAVKGTEIFAGTQFNGVICSTDSGKTWQMTDTSMHKEIDAITTEGNYIFAGGGAIMVRSTDNGSSWTLIQNGLGYGQTTVTGMVITEGKILASTFAGVVVSTDNGDSWSTLVGTNQSDQVTNCVAVIDSTVLVGWQGGIIRSTDDGRDWYYPQNWISTNIIYSIVGDSSRIYAGTTDGVHVSTDDGVTWTPVNNGLPGEQGWYLIQNDTNLFVADGNYGVYVSPDSGSSWAQQSEGIRGWSGEDISGNGIDIFATMSSPTGGNQLLYHSTDNGETWMQDTSWHSGWIQSLKVTNSFTYATTNSGIFESSDKGESWNSINGGVIDTVYPINIVKSGSNLIVSTQKKGELFLSSDNGSSWRNVGKDLPIIGPLAVSGNDVFAGNEGDWTNGNDGIYQSTDNGLNWTLINDTLRNIGSLVVGGSNIIACRYFPPVPISDTVLPPPGGVFLSTNNGHTWSPFVEGLPEYPQVYTVATHNSNVFVGLEAEGYPSEFYYRNVNQGRWKKEGQSLPVTSVHTVYASDSSVFVGASDAGIWSEPLSQITSIRRTASVNLPSSFELEQNYPNPFNPTTVISYQLLALSHVKLDVYNVLGQKVVELVNKEEPEGTYKVTFNASNLASGVYFYRLKAGNFVDTKKLVLLK